MKTLRERGIPTTIEMPVSIPTPDGKGIAETVMVKVDALRDPENGEIYLNGETLEKLDKIKARRMGVLMPREIKELREQFGLTQREMSIHMGIGEKSYSRWENGRERPSQSMNRLLVALWEGRLSVGDLTSMRQPAFPWYERMTGCCPCGSEHKPTTIATNVKAEKGGHNEGFDLAA